MRHTLWMILVAWVGKRALDAGWEYLKQGVQWVRAALVLILLLRILAVFVAAYNSQPRPAILGRA